MARIRCSETITKQALAHLDRTLASVVRRPAFPGRSSCAPLLLCAVALVLFFAAPALLVDRLLPDHVQMMIEAAEHNPPLHHERRRDHAPRQVPREISRLDLPQQLAGLPVNGM